MGERAAELWKTIAAHGSLEELVQGRKLLSASTQLGQQIVPLKLTHEDVVSLVELMKARVPGCLASVEDLAAYAETWGHWEKLPEVRSRLLRSQDSHVRAEVVFELSMSPDKGHAPLLLPLLEDPSEDVSRKAAWALNGIISKQLIPKIRPFLEDPRPSVRRGALAALASEKASSCFKEVAARLGDDDPSVRREAVTTLVAMNPLDHEKEVDALLAAKDAPPELALLVLEMKNASKVLEHREKVSALLRSADDDTVFEVARKVSALGLKAFAPEIGAALSNAKSGPLTQGVLLRALDDLDARDQIEAVRQFVDSKLAGSENTASVAAELLAKWGRPAAAPLAPASDPAAALALLEAAGLERLKAGLKKIIAPSIRLRARPVPKKSLAVGASRIGGDPDVPAGFKWPTYKRRRMALLAQINLAEVVALDPASRLPGSGFLYFFCDQEDGVLALPDPVWKVIFADVEAAQLKRAKGSGDGAFRSCALEPSTEISFPSWSDPSLKKLKLTEDEREAYRSFHDRLIASSPCHKLLGYPDTIQDYLYAKEGGQLLFQLDSDKDAAMMWGDAGRVYFSIRPEALKKGDFEDVWMDFQGS